MQIVIVAKGSYPKELPEPLARALEEEIRLHMKGYGLTDIEVTAADFNMQKKTLAELSRDLGDAIHQELFGL